MAVSRTPPSHCRRPATATQPQWPAGDVELEHDLHPLLLADDAALDQPGDEELGAKT